MAALALLAALAAVRSPLNAGPLYGFPSGKRATTASLGVSYLVAERAVPRGST